MLSPVMPSFRQGVLYDFNHVAWICCIRFTIERTPIVRGNHNVVSHDIAMGKTKSNQD